ncbi:acyl-CoA dehydrogenase [Rhodobacter sp. TJ_12]|uniref:acyl-CoA dehydrogenase family protein n=1 Tax=Rhodobacter sp. TJ_12 TaxID=2029399 RepID=UPI001CC06A46|nr:acyl-CoA dehydrogenase family protein [Rhodobacter sp. TJ_12]MBZ4021527.1 acyl-CoA dehydrogenase [Rhodobacter sp. TJ_12]
MTAFAAPVEDILFAFEVAGAPQLPDWDGDLAQAVLDHFAAFAQGEIAPLDAPGDAQGCQLEAGQVRMPDGFGHAYANYVDQGWHALSLPEALGGQDAPAPLSGAVSEIFAGACHALEMVTGLVPGAARVLLRFGSKAQQAKHLPDLASGAALATMCLTEPGAGSDLSAIRTRAKRVGEEWRITGEKIFISGGGQDMSDSILHLLLARTGPVAAGVKGLSLFLARSGGAFGANGVTVARLEEKLGLHASPTCHMVFDNTAAELIGDEGAGLTAMFTLMNHARLDVALQGVAHAARAHRIALAHALDRQQGRCPDGRPARLVDHADVRRMLDRQRALELSSRAMCQLALVEMARGTRPELLEFLTPLVKITATEAGIEAADLGIQILGGYGYLTEYRVSQTWRDARITSIYEGANGVHAGALAGRLLRWKGGAAATAFAELVRDLAPDAPDVAQALAQWREMRSELLIAPDPGAKAWAFAHVSARVLTTALWHRMAMMADHAPDPAEIRRLAALHLPASANGARGAAVRQVAPCGSLG